MSLLPALLLQEAKTKQTSSWFAKKVMDFMTEYRGIVIVTVVLPLSFSIELFFEFRDWFYRTFQVFQAVVILCRRHSLILYNTSWLWCHARTSGQPFCGAEPYQSKTVLAADSTLACNVR